MNIQKLIVIGLCAVTITASASEEKEEPSTEEGDASAMEYDGNAAEQQMMHTTYRYARGTQIYSVGWSSGGAQYGVFYGCKGKGQPLDVEEFPGDYTFDECAVVSYGDGAGNWMNSPDGRFFYIQNMEFMGNRIFELVDIDALDVVSNLNVPSVSVGATGPDPAKGEVGFSNSGDTFLAIVPRINRTELLIYDRTTPSAWALRESLPMDTSLSGVYPVEKERTLLWTRSGNLRLYDIETKKNLWTVSVPMVTDGDTDENVGTKVVVVSPNLQFALLVSARGAVLVAVHSGEVLAMHSAGDSEPLSMACTDQYPEGITDSLPRSPGQCGQLVVRDDGSASVVLQSGATVRLAPR